MLSITNEEFLELRKKVIEKEFMRMNDMQRKAVFSVNGPLLILAGAGSGKTTVVVNRIAYLVHYGNAYESTFISNSVDDDAIQKMRNYLNGGEIDDDTRHKISVSACKPWSIMAITFTNKAAGELKDRLCKMLGSDGEEIWASTFHSSCARILRRFGDRLGYTTHFTIYDTDDCIRLMKNCIKDINVSEKLFAPRSVLSEISKAKDQMIDAKTYLDNNSGDFRLKIIGDLYSRYQARLLAADAMDFDDLIINTVRLFESNSDVLEYYQNRFNYIMVDEYQDTDHTQYSLVSYLAGKKQNICVVGDDDQSIYKFRGATIENILSFEENFNHAKVIRLEQNYRSTSTILDAANAVISNNKERKGKKLWTTNGKGIKIDLHLSEDERQEAYDIGRKIEDLIASGKKYSDIAILYRLNSQSQAFERIFAKEGIPHRIIGGIRFYERAEIKDMLSYLSIVSNPSDEIRLKRILNRPKRGIGDKTIDTANQIATELGLSLFEVISDAGNYPALSRSAQKLKEFSVLINNLREKSKTLSIDQLYNSIIEDTEFEKFLKEDDIEKSEEKIENIKELSTNIQRYEEENPEEGLDGFLEEVSLITDIDNYSSDTDSVVLMTIHSAKGLEFPIVFLPGWENGIFPRSTMYDNDIEEERRLAYVALTRAKEQLHIYHTEQRMIFGSTGRNPLSQFALEIPSELIEKTGEMSSEFISPFSKAWSDDDETNSDLSESKRKIKQPDGFYKATPKIKPEPKGKFKPGDSVIHKMFGKGMVISAKDMGNDTLLEISFEKVGTKKIFANFAKLEKTE
jgi:DNA helicase-2/ATP-dependent DNA helicase PcrA